MRPEHNIRKALCMNQEDFARLLKVSLSLVSLEEINLRKYPNAASSKATDILRAFLKAEKEITIPRSENYISMLMTKVGANGSFQEVLTEQKKNHSRKLTKAKLVILKLELEREKLFEKFEDLWKALEFLEKYLPTVTDDHDQKLLENARFFVEFNVEKAGLRLLEIDADLLRLQAEGKALEIGLAWMSYPA